MEKLSRFFLTLLFGKGGETMMAMLWAQKIMFGKKKFSEVPRLLKPQVKEILIESGLPELVEEEGK